MCIKEITYMPFDEMCKLGLDQDGDLVYRNGVPIFVMCDWWRDRIVKRTPYIRRRGKIYKIRMGSRKFIK